jgi:autotransporter-associated beta strand protein
LTSNLTVAVGRSQDTFTISGNVSGVGSVTLNGTSTSQAIGTVVLSGTNSYQGATTVNTGTLVVGAHGALPSTTTLTVGTATTTAAVKLAVNSGAQTISGLTINPNSTVDIGNNHFILDYAAGTQAATDSTILSYLQAGRNGGAWNGANGIISTGSSGTGVAAGYSIGYADGADHVVTGLSSGQIEVKYTLLGDANLDGLVTGDDFTILVGNLGKAVTGWDKGDFLYTGLVTGDDFTALVGNLGKSATGADVAIPAADYAAIDAFAAANGLTLPSVPEPASASLLIVAGMGILARRHRSCEA